MFLLCKMISYTLLCPTVVFLRWRTNDSTFCFAMSRKCTRVHTALLCYELVTIASTRHYWAIQAGLLTPLIFARHRLSSLAAFTSGAYFLHSGRRLQWLFHHVIDVTLVWKKTSAIIVVTLRSEDAMFKKYVKSCNSITAELRPSNICCLDWVNLKNSSV